MERNRWYKDAVFYQIWPRSFADGNGDGIGDLWGVLEKLDYIASLNVTGIWFSPLYVSPQADFGYDIADYPQAFHNYEHEISLPVYPQLDNEKVDFVIKTVKEAYEKVSSIKD